MIADLLIWWLAAIIELQRSELVAFLLYLCAGLLIGRGIATKDRLEIAIGASLFVGSLTVG